MPTGETPVTPIEEWMRWTPPRLIISRRATLTPGNWRLELCSPFWRLYVNKTAGARVLSNGHWLSLSPGMIYILPAWLEFSTEVTGSVVQRYLHFEFSSLPLNLTRGVFDRPIELACTGSLRPLCAKWMEGIEETGNPSMEHHAWAQAFLHATVATLLETLPADFRNPSATWRRQAHELRPALAKIENQLAEPPDNTELARLCGLSTPHFSRRFKAAMGVTLAQYRLERRVMAAAQWLAGTERSIDEIADATGFTDRFYFSKMFKVRMGSAPAAYRRMHRQEFLANHPIATS